MSHFTVLVVGENPEEQLQPFHEFECTGESDQYVQEIDQTEEARESYESSEKDKPFADYIEDYYGRKKVFKESDIDLGEKHKYGYTLCAVDGTVIKTVDRTNPNKKWDWYVLGGRWSGHLLLKDGSKSDQAKKGDVDFEGMRNAEEKEAVENYDFVKSKIEGLPVPESWESVRERIKEIDLARSFYHDQPMVKRFKERDISDRVGWSADIDKYLRTREEHALSARNSAVSTFALVKESKWYEKGEMGWFAFVSNEKSDWNEEFSKLMDSISDDTLLSVYDCHI